MHITTLPSHPSLFFTQIPFCVFTFVGAQARKNESPAKRQLSNERGNAAAAGAAAGAATATAGGAVNAVSEDPTLAYLHAVVAVVIGSFLSGGQGGLASGTLAVGVRAHVSSS